MVYYSFLFLLAFSALVFNFSPKREKSKGYEVVSIFFFFLFIFFGGFRYEVGADWLPYSVYFGEIKTWTDVLESRREKLYETVVLVFNKANLSYLTFVPVFFATSFFIKYKVFQRYSCNIFLSLIIYFYTVFVVYDLNGIRQGMSLAITLYSLKYIISRRPYKFLFCILLAIGFHYSALFFVPAYWLYAIKLVLTRKKTIILICILIIIAIPLRVIIQQYTSAYLEADQLLNHYSTYLDTDYNVGSSIISMGTIQRLIIFIIYIFAVNKSKSNITQFEMFLGKAYFLGIIIFVFFSFSMEYAARLSFCYKFLETIMLPIAVQKASKDERVTILFIIFFFATFSIYQSLHLPNQGYLLPYHNQLFNF